LKHGKLSINEEQAKTVKLIFDLYLNQGMGVSLISKELENRAITTPRGNLRWKKESVLQILKNDKYTGRLKQRKQITTDYLTHKRKTNKGEEAYIIIENHHEPIITHEIFDSVQKEIDRRRATTLDKGRYSNRYPWSGKIKCAYCNSTFKRKINNYASKNPSIVWICAEALKYGKEKVNVNNQKVGCNCRAVHERILQENFLAVLDMVIENKNRVVQELREHVRQNIVKSPDKSKEIKDVGSAIEKMAVRQSKLIDMCVDGLITKVEYEKTQGQYDKQVAVLNKQWVALKLDNRVTDTLQQKLDKLDATIGSLVRLKEFGDSICSEVLHKVVVEGRDKMVFYLSASNNTNPVFFQVPPLIMQSMWQKIR
jgi:hypothetical protein